MKTVTEKSEKQRNEAAADKACREIRRLIINYEYKPGDRLYETTLAEEMAMSRTPIREALTRLVSCGFLERDPHRRGYRVPSLSVHDMQTAFRLRLVLEKHVVLLAADRMTPEDIDYLYSLNEQEQKRFAEENRTAYADLNEKFHLTLAAKSEDAYALRYIEELLSRTTLYGVFFAAFYLKLIRGTDVNVRRTPAYVEHRAVIDALAAGDARLAAEMAKQHLLDTYAHYSGHPLTLPDSDSPY